MSSCCPMLRTPTPGDHGQLKRPFHGALRSGLLLTIVAVNSLTACAPTGGDPPPPCEEPASENEACCDPAVYQTVAIPNLARAPGELAGQRVEVEGVADWYTNMEGSSDCVCAGGICACIKPLAMRATFCGDQIRLAGQYRGRPVECSDAGCWPLQPLSEVAVCGLFSWDVGAPRPGGEGKIELEAFCER